MFGERSEASTIRNLAILTLPLLAGAKQ